MCGRTDKNSRYEFDAGAKITANHGGYVTHSKCCTEVMFDTIRTKVTKRKR